MYPTTFRNTSSLNPGLRKTDHNTGVAFFERASVQSSIGKTKLAGEYYAIPYPTQPKPARSGVPADHFVSEYTYSFKNPHYQYCSMSQKPLSRYAQNATRSKNAIPNPPVPGWNHSTLNLSRRAGYTAKRRFVTTNQAAYGGSRPEVRNNAGIIAYETKWLRTQREK